jgi:hypothetical protein
VEADDVEARPQLQRQPGDGAGEVDTGAARSARVDRPSIQADDNEIGRTW